MYYIRNHIARSAAYDSVFSFFIAIISFTLSGGRLPVRDDDQADRRPFEAQFVRSLSHTFTVSAAALSRFSVGEKLKWIIN